MSLGRDTVRIALTPPAHTPDDAGGGVAGWGSPISVWAGRSVVPARVTLRHGVLSDVETQMFTVWKTSQIAGLSHRWKLSWAGSEWAIRAVDLDEAHPRARLVVVAERGEAVTV